MISRRDATRGALLAMAALATTGKVARADMPVSEADALAALDPWADALFSGDPVAIEKVLAPEYQIVRSDGSGYNKTDYMSTLPEQSKRSQFNDIVATGNGNLIVIRYTIDTDQIIEGMAVEAVSPRLSVFRKDGGRWLLVAHANFARLG